MIFLLTGDLGACSCSSKQRASANVPRKKQKLRHPPIQSVSKFEDGRKTAQLCQSGLTRVPGISGRSSSQLSYEQRKLCRGWGLGEGSVDPADSAFDLPKVPNRHPSAQPQDSKCDALQSTYREPLIEHDQNDHASRRPGSCHHVIAGFPGCRIWHRATRLNDVQPDHTLGVLGDSRVVELLDSRDVLGFKAMAPIHQHEALRVGQVKRSVFELGNEKLAH